MYRKPFRTPFLKPVKKDNDIHDDNEKDDSSTTGISYPPRKKTRLDRPGNGNESGNDESETGATKKVTFASQATTKPFVSFNKVAIPKNVVSVLDERQDGETGGEMYFNVLWRKFTTKKHKTFDGDGVLVVAGGYVTLQDLSGKALGKSLWSKNLEPGDQLSIGGKEVEIDSPLSRADYMAGKPFLKNANAAPVNSLGMTTSITPTVLPTRQFKVPLLTPMVPKPKGTSKSPTPRHDPNAPDALVMPRPPPSYIPSGKRLVDVVVDPFISQHLRPHQREGVTFMYEAVMGLKSTGYHGAILADEMGLGKTLQTITLLWTLMKQNPIYDPGSIGSTGGRPVVKKALIVCPVTLISNWRKEFRKWLGNERIAVLPVGEKTNIRDFTQGKIYNVMIVGYERLQKIQGELKKAEIDIVIADEGHRLKSENNKAAQAIRSLKTQRRIILSGTPLQNDLREFFVMVDFVNPGLLDTYPTFRRTFEALIVKSRQPEATAKDIEKGKARGDELASITKMFILRRTAEILSKYLPPKTEFVVFCRPTRLQLDIYKAILDSPMFNTYLTNPQSSLKLITLLKKICNSPALLAKGYDDKDDLDFASSFLNIKASMLTANASGKLRVLGRMLVTLRETTDEKIVIVSNYTSTLDLLQNLLSAKGYSFLRLDGTTPAAKRQDLVDKFNRTDSEASFAFLLSAKSGGTGINLIGASRLVLYDLDWNPATDQQAMARIHRDGQRKEVRIYRMITTGCIDEKIYQRQLSKQGLADSVMDQKSSASNFSLAELRDLFTLDEDTDCQTHDLLGCDCTETGGGNLLGIAGGSTNNEVMQPAVAVDVLFSERTNRRQDDGQRTAGSDRNQPGEDENNNSSDSEYVPEDLLPGLMKASQVDMAKIEEDFIKSRSNMRKAKKAQLSILMGYEHFSGKLLMAATSSGGESIGKSDDTGESDSMGEGDGDEESSIDLDNGIDNGDECGGENSPDIYLADDVLRSIIRKQRTHDKAGTVSFVFQKYD